MSKRILKHTYNLKLVEKISILDHKNEISRRSYLKISLKKPKGKQVLFIMMNPSRATKNESDKTINQIITYTANKCRRLADVNEIVIMNLYTVYETASGKLGEYIEKYGFDFCTGNEEGNPYKNDDLIFCESSKSDFIVVAWGRPNGLQKNLHDCNYHNRTVSVLKTIEPYKDKIYHLDVSLRDNIYPKHPVKIKYSWDIHKLNFKFIENNLHKKLQITNQ